MNTSSTDGGAFVTFGRKPGLQKFGMNAYGMPVFVDTDAAFDAILEDCPTALLTSRRHFNHPVITKK
jgi:hypothetical protein